MVVLFVFCSGCAVTSNFEYPAKTKKLIRFAEGPIYKQKIAVIAFEEMRGDESQVGTLLWCLVPIVPFCVAQYERPDEAAWMLHPVRGFFFDPPWDLAEAATYSLRKSNLFEDVSFAFKDDLGDANLLLEGEILSTDYHGSVNSYGLSIFGSILYLFGLPTGRSQNDLILYLRLKDVKTKTVLWEEKYVKKHSVTHGIYYNQFGSDIKYYSVMMQEIMNDAIEDINSQLQKTKFADK